MNTNTIYKLMALIFVIIIPGSFIICAIGVVVKGIMAQREVAHD